MPRTKTKEKSAPQTAERVEYEAAGVLTETRHLACPICGLMARLAHDPLRHDRRHGKPLPSIEGGPYPTYARMQTYGGKGYIQWEDPEELSDGELTLLTNRITTALEGLQAGSLLELPELEETELKEKVIRPRPVRRQKMTRRPAAGPSRAQELIEQVRRFGAKARAIRTDPNLARLNNLQGEFDSLWRDVGDLQDEVEGEDKERLEELDHEMERASAMFDPARAAIVRVPIDYKQWNIAMGQLATCCGQKITQEEEESPAATEPKPPRPPKTPPAPKRRPGPAAPSAGPIKVTWRYADVPGGPVTEHDTPPPSQPALAAVEPAESSPAVLMRSTELAKTEDTKRAAVLSAHAKLKAMEKPNLRSANLAIEKLQEQDIDVREAEDALSDYGGLERKDYDTAEGYREAREEAWDEFLDRLEEAEQEE